MPDFIESLFKVSEYQAGVTSPGNCYGNLLVCEGDCASRPSPTAEAVLAVVLDIVVFREIP